jgi:hypothetical protein
MFAGVATLTEHGEWLLTQGRESDAQPLLTEARQIFDRLGARRVLWLARRPLPHF